MRQLFIKLLFVSGLLRQDNQKVVLRRRAYISLLLFPYFLFLLMRACYDLRKSRLYSRKIKGIAYKFNLTIVAIAKNEAAYISEWLAFHKLQGVEKVFLYDNESTDNMRDVLQPYIAAGYVEYNVINGKYKQFEAYNDAIRRYGHLAKYMAFIDCDEFMMPVNSDKSLLEIIEYAFLKDENAGGLGINWCIYGSSGHETKPERGLVIENFTHHSYVDYERNYTIKSIVKPCCVKIFSHPHYPMFRPGFYNIDFQGKFIPFWRNEITEYDGIRLNHYYCKSKEEYAKRISLGKADSLHILSMDNFIKDDRNEVLDDSMLVYANDVKKVMAIYQICIF